MKRIAVAIDNGWRSELAADATTSSFDLEVPPQAGPPTAPLWCLFTTEVFPTASC